MRLLIALHLVLLASGACWRDPLQQRRVCRADLETVALALEEYRERNGGYPVSDSLSSVLQQIGLVTAETLDPWGGEYKYSSGSSGGALASSYLLSCCGDDQVCSGDQGMGEILPEDDGSKDLVINTGTWEAWPSIPSTADLGVEMSLNQDFGLAVSVSNLGPDLSEDIQVELFVNEECSLVHQRPWSSGQGGKWMTASLRPLPPKETHSLVALWDCEPQGLDSASVIAVTRSYSLGTLDPRLSNNVASIP